MSDTRQSRVFIPADKSLPPYRIEWLTRIVYGNVFEFTVVGLIVVNAFFLAALTLPDLDPTFAAIARTYDSVVLWVYVVELALRILSYGKKPWMFFTSPWNIFDFLVIALIPVFSAQTVVLRLLRLLRVVRLFRFMPEVRILTNSIVKSMPPLASVTVLILFLLFLYAMVGHYLFGTALPEHWGDITKAMESLFILLTLENFPNYFQEAMAVTPAALMFFLSYVFIIVFTILNVLIGIVINAMDESRAQEQRASKDHWSEMFDAIDGLERDGDSDQAGLIALRQEVLRVQNQQLTAAPATPPAPAAPSKNVRRGVGKRNTGGASSSR
ncbi:voltage-gated sodium channel [Pontimonas salivibrio]|uniref:Voltage-gated sodium channel n=1 Tax=Pontimonas salivibrio TaxID=1159327 RepID=A0A2L2BP27_9MICO|nr:ion transporter [Pontimonas salivibrio]AVG23397.1 voltage-gated sodium channel [Pontimonas salivibrio]